MHYHESFLGDFSGFLQVDSHSNAFLNLTLIEVMGSIHGTIASSNFTQVNYTFRKSNIFWQNLSSFQVLQVSIGSQKLARAEKRLKVVGLLNCNMKSQIIVTLKPYGSRTGSAITRNLPCSVDSLRHFRHVLSHNEMTLSSNQLPAASLSKNCLGCSETWFYYIHPWNWADSFWNTTRLIITVIVILIALFSLAICVKIGLCIKQCCCWHFFFLFVLSLQKVLVVLSQSFNRQHQFSISPSEIKSNFGPFQECRFNACIKIFYWGFECIPRTTQFCSSLEKTQPFSEEDLLS